MCKIITLILSVCLLTVGVIAQTNDITGVLREIDQNNQELKALRSLLESRQFELKSSNNLSDPQVGAFYLSFGDHTTGDYLEFQLSQTFEFPTVYGTRGNLIEAQQDQLELEYSGKRQDVLLAAQKYCLELISLNKRISFERERAQQAKTVFDQMQQLFEEEQVGILELNKAKVAWMQKQFKVQQLESEKRNLSRLLENLNGGVTLAFDQVDYFDDLELAERDSIWQHKLTSDPGFQKLKQQEMVAKQQLKLSKNKSLPNLTAGYNYQGVSGANFSGIYAGTSIPLWSNQGKVKAAELNLKYWRSFSDVRTIAAYVSFEKQYNDYQILLVKLREYQSTLQGLNSDQLMLQAYQLGEISFIEYYQELNFYRQAIDSMLEMEKQLYQLKAEILKHQL